MAFATVTGIASFAFVFFVFVVVLAFLAFDDSDILAFDDVLTFDVRSLSLGGRVTSHQRF